MTTLEGRQAVTLDCAAVVRRDGQVLLVRGLLGRYRLPGRRVDPLRHAPETAVREVLQALGLQPTRLALCTTHAGVMLFDARVEGEPVDDLFQHPEWVSALDAQWRVTPAVGRALARFVAAPEPAPEEASDERTASAGDSRAGRAHGKVPARLAMEQAGELKPRP